MTKKTHVFEIHNNIQPINLSDEHTKLITEFAKTLKKEIENAEDMDKAYLIGAYYGTHNAMNMLTTDECHFILDYTAAEKKFNEHVQDIDKLNILLHFINDILKFEPVTDKKDTKKNDKKESKN